MSSNGNGNGYGCLTPRRIRADVEQWLAGHVGMYLFANNGGSTTAPAIAILPDPTYGWEYPPEDTRISGLEVVIEEVPIASTPLLNKEAHERQDWRIFLKCWDSNGKLNRATQALVRGLTRSDDYLYSSPVPIPPNERLGMVPIITLVVSEHQRFS